MAREGWADCRQRIINVDPGNTIPMNLQQAAVVPAKTIAANEKNFGMKVDIVGSKPMDVFSLTQKLISVMVNETNKYAEQELDKKRPLPRGSVSLNESLLMKM